MLWTFKVDYTGKYGFRLKKNDEKISSTLISAENQKKGSTTEKHLSHVDD